MDRRTFSVGLAVLVLWSPASAQPGSRMYVIGWLAPSLPSAWRAAFVEGMREHGWVEGRDFKIDVRAAPSLEQAEEAARQLAGGSFDVLVGSNTAYVLALRRATTTLPIVMAASGYPVEVGLAASLARPGGNVTGSAFYAGVEMFAKFVELLRAARPGMTRLGVLWGYTAFPDGPVALNELRRAARAAGITLTLHLLRAPDEVERALRSLEADKVHALFTTSAGPVTWPHRLRISEFALTHRLPSLTDVLWPDANRGVLLTYAVRMEDVLRRTARFVDRILRGAKPGDLPIEQPTAFDLTINMRTAKTLGLTLPPSLLLRATQVIE
jgi:putative ABC transport system substrate-binding protein